MSKRTSEEIFADLIEMRDPDAFPEAELEALRNHPTVIPFKEPVSIAAPAAQCGLIEDGPMKGLTIDEPKRVMTEVTERERMVVVCRSKGMTRKEIAHYFKMTEKSVWTTLSQPWAKALLNELVKDQVQDAKAIFRREAAPSIEVLVSIRDDERAPKGIRAQCAMHLLDRHLGKPSEPKDDRTPQSIEELDAELDRLRKQISDAIPLPAEARVIETEKQHVA